MSNARRETRAKSCVCIIRLYSFGRTRKNCSNSRLRLLVLITFLAFLNFHLRFYNVIQTTEILKENSNYKCCVSIGRPSLGETQKLLKQAVTILLVLITFLAFLNFHLRFCSLIQTTENFLYLNIRW